ncbi:GNAT family N-acetyltransferase [Parvibaculum sp.]|uniref:GNAT family N-acetyltransferase n=1 Tax=Parvibaculum sp. TaxID=2024848 RepID=UPI001B070C49|nr:GNAT family N-acetyltransferase [Parvibaculum sp.]MBO6635422.1 GNAT family N-acetyltransferase [Parvibaculum sp.]MBO6678757.1 GNAT family N-acetyltransferase [Parvibaculum sp.]MBO6686260.1 GNAT family N-acetyltransferase [Parvibaculum sp.]MBO6905703.1 GNAT family N-acetyltransferase [Parvibaculum sp.]
MSAGAKIEIERASAGDIPALARVWHDAWHAGHAHLDPEIATGRPFAFFEARMGSAIDRMAVARVDGEIVGFSGWEGDGIGQVFVLPAWHGRGVAAPLLRAAEDALKEQGHALIWLQCRIGNGRARAFYEKHGWYVAREVEADIGTVAGREPIKVWQMEKRFAG